MVTFKMDNMRVCGTIFFGRAITRDDCNTLSEELLNKYNISFELCCGLSTPLQKCGNYLIGHKSYGCLELKHKMWVAFFNEWLYGDSCVSLNEISRVARIKKVFLL